jgi:hypothetical protein
MTLALSSALLALLNLASAALIAERRRTGWLVALAAQIPWTWYDLWTRQIGFLLLTLIYVPVYVRGWRKARNPASPPSAATDGTPATKTSSTRGNEAAAAAAASTAAGAGPAATPFRRVPWRTSPTSPKARERPLVGHVRGSWAGRLCTAQIVPFRHGNDGGSDGKVAAHKADRARRGRTR